MTETVYKPAPAFKPLYRRQHRYYAYHGGRGGGKSWGVADYILLAGTLGVERVLCCREVQKSIRESVKRLLDDRIAALGLGGFYTSLETEIRGKNGTLINFTGLLGHTADSIKSFEGATITWIEEAHSVCQRSLDVLIPTVIRTERPQIIFTLNPDLPSDPVYADFVASERHDCHVTQINYTDNPHCPQALVDEAERMRVDDPAKYEHVWLGAPKLIAEGAIYRAELEQARAQGRICRVAYDPNLPVFTGWDLGILDPTAIWFAQVYGKEVRLIDYYEANGEPLAHYARILSERGYSYVGGKHFLPHDVAARDLSSGVSRQQTLADLGVIASIGARLGPEDRIEASRQLFRNVWIDAERCKRGLECLQNYRRAFNQQMNEFKADPVHDWSSHAADAFGELALAVRKMQAPASKVVNVPRLHRTTLR